MAKTERFALPAARTVAYDTVRPDVARLSAVLKEDALLPSSPTTTLFRIDAQELCATISNCSPPMMATRV